MYYAMAINSEELPVPIGSIGVVLDELGEIEYRCDRIVGDCWKIKNQNMPYSIRVDFGNGIVIRKCCPYSVWLFTEFPIGNEFFKSEKFSKKEIQKKKKEWPEKMYEIYCEGVKRGPYLPYKYKLLYNFARRHGLNPGDFEFDVRFNGEDRPVIAYHPDYLVYVIDGRWILQSHEEAYNFKPYEPHEKIRPPIFYSNTIGFYPKGK